MSDDGRREFMLTALRAAVLKAKLIENELTAIGVSLKHGMIDPEGVMQWLHEEGLTFLLPQVESGGSTATSAASAEQRPSPSSRGSGASPTS